MRTALRRLVAVSLLACSQVTKAQQSVFIEAPTVTADLTYEIEDEAREGEFIDRDEQTDTFTRSVEIETRGWVYHPGLVSFEFETEPEWKTETIDTTDREERTNDQSFFNYALDATFLKFKPYTFKLYSAQSRTDFDNALTEDTTVDNNINRLSLLLKYQPLSSTLTLETRETDTEGFADNRITADTFRATAQHQLPKSITNLFAEFTQEDRKSVSLDDSVDRTRFHVSNNWTMRESALLLSNLTAHRDDPEKGLITKNRFFRINERLRIRHRDNLRSHYDLSYDSREIAERQVDTRRAEVGLVHKLYENLTTTANARTSDVTGDEGDDSIYEGDLDLQYVRSIPWGQIDAFTGLAYRVEDNARDADFIINERVILTGIEEVELGQLNIDIDTVVVASLDELIVFEEGTDYILDPRGDIVFIRRTGPSSNIESGETVLVDYQFEPIPPFKIEGRSWRAGMGLSLWNALRLSYAYSRSEEDLLSGSEPPDLADDTIQTAGAELRWRWSTTRVDYEDRDTVRNPTTTRRFQERLLFRFGRRVSTFAEASYTERDLHELDDTQEIERYSANLRWRFPPRASLEIEAFDQSIRDDRQDTEDTGVRSELRWRYGLWFARINYQFARHEDNFTQERRDNQRVLFQVRRRFW